MMRLKLLFRQRNSTRLVNHQHKWCQCHNKYILIINFHLFAMKFGFSWHLAYQRSWWIKHNLGTFVREKLWQKGWNVKKMAFETEAMAIVNSLHTNIFGGRKTKQTKICAIKINTHSRTCTIPTRELDNNNPPAIWIGCASSKQHGSFSERVCVSLTNLCRPYEKYGGCVLLRPSKYIL